MKIALVQYSPVWENKEENIIKIDSLVDNFITDEDLIIFPEMTLTGFTMNADSHAEEIDGIGINYFIKLARRLKKHIFAGIIEKDDDKIYNSLIHFDDNGLIFNKYKKVHLFTPALENQNYSSGNERIVTEINKVKFGLSICYDLRFPEFYRFYGKERVDVIVNIASWPEARIDHWLTLLKARAIENQCFSIGVNRSGDDISYKYCGNSCAFSPMGSSLLEIDTNERVFSFEINLEEVTKFREKLKFLDDIKLI